VSQTVQWAPINKVVAAGVALSSSRGLSSVLQTLVDTARDISGARYAALGVLDPSGDHLAEFLTSGVSHEVGAQLGGCPVGRGLLGVLMHDPRPLRLHDAHLHPEAQGVPDGHPPIRTLLGVPIVARDRVFGNLYVAEKIDDYEFSEDDLALLEMLAALAAAAIENAQLREERDRFFAAASHELGNAVAGVRLWAEHLQDMSKDAPANWIRGLERIQKGADGAHKLIDDLLSLARIREGRLTLVPWPVNVSVVLLESAEQFRPEVEKAGLRIDTSAVERDLVTKTDSARLRQIFVNLLSNAVKFTHPGTTISLGATRTDDRIVMYVADQGPGIAPVDAERIFRPYEQVSGVARGRGAGLGLPLSRQLARLMGGELVVQPTPQSGARFVLSLPILNG
jgi:signal transduction histidine kinase